jgi:methylated-DNA-[protein]-cysteine S-methyltransferase
MMATNRSYYSELDAPVGPLLLLGDGVALAGLYMDGQQYRPPLPGECRRDNRLFRPLREQLRAYFAGELQAFDVPLAARGTPFQQRVWQLLRTIPYGTTTTYGELARRLGNGNASRAVGLANGRNPIGIVIPCHRVVGADGALTGYAGGIERKRWLLEHERRHTR